MEINIVMWYEHEGWVWRKSVRDGCERWVWGMIVWDECEGWAWGVNVKDECEGWVWGMIVRDECERWAWGVNVKDEGEGYVWGMGVRDDCEGWVWLMSLGDTTFKGISYHCLIIDFEVAIELGYGPIGLAAFIRFTSEFKSVSEWELSMSIWT